MISNRDDGCSQEAYDSFDDIFLAICRTGIEGNAKYRRLLSMAVCRIGCLLKN